MDTFEQMVEAGAVSLSMELGWAFPHETHREMARTVLDASNVPHLLTRLQGLEDGARRVQDVLTWAREAVDATRAGDFSPLVFPQLELESSED